MRSRRLKWKLTDCRESERGAGSAGARTSSAAVAATRWPFGSQLRSLEQYSDVLVRSRSEALFFAESSTFTLPLTRATNESCQAGVDYSYAPTRAAAVLVAARRARLARLLSAAPHLADQPTSRLTDGRTSRPDIRIKARTARIECSSRGSRSRSECSRRSSRRRRRRICGRSETRHRQMRRGRRAETVHWRE